MNELGKRILEKILRRRFDSKDCYEPESKQIIDIARKLELNREFIETLVDDYKTHYNL